MRERWLVRIAAALALSVVVTGGLAVALTLQRRGAVGEGNPARIAFVSDREGDLAVYVADVGTDGAIDRSSLRRVSPEGWDAAAYPTWSPDGEWVAYLTWREGESAVWVSSADGSDRVRVSGIVTDVTSVVPSWSPDGARLAFVSQPLLAAAGVPTATVHLVRASGEGLGQSLPLGEFVVIEMEFSPTGRELLLVAAPAGGYSGAYLLPIDGGGMRLFHEQATAADWAPDGEAAVVADPTTHTLYVVRRGGAMEEIAAVGNATVEEVAWSPDGRYIALRGYYRGTQGEGPALFILDLEVEEMLEVDVEAVVEEVRLISDLDWSPDGQRLLFTAIPGYPRPDADLPYADLWVYDVTTGELHRLTWGEGWNAWGVWE